MNNKNELYHYGIPGMKWGNRRGQTSSGSNKTKTNKDQMDAEEAAKERKKKMIKRGLIAVGVAAAAIGTIAMIKHHKKKISLGKKTVSEITGQDKKLAKDMTKRINKNKGSSSQKGSPFLITPSSKTKAQSKSSTYKRKHTPPFMRSTVNAMKRNQSIIDKTQKKNAAKAAKNAAKAAKKASLFNIKDPLKAMARNRSIINRLRRK